MLSLWLLGFPFCCYRSPTFPFIPSLQYLYVHFLDTEAETESHWASPSHVVCLMLEPGPGSIFPRTFWQKGPHRPAWDGPEVWDQTQSSAHSPRNCPEAWSSQCLMGRSHCDPRASPWDKSLGRYREMQSSMSWVSGLTHTVLAEMGPIAMRGRSDRYSYSCLKRRELEYERLSD